MDVRRPTPSAYQTNHSQGLSGFWLTVSAAGWTVIIMLACMFWWPLFVYVFDYWF